MGWGEAKFRGLCKAEPAFSSLLKQKREDARVKKLCEYTSLLDEAARKGNIIAVIFGLKALGVSDGSQPVQEPEKEAEKDLNELNWEDYTDAELLKMKHMNDAARKRKTKKQKK